MSAVTHFAGLPVFVHGRYLRQRCGWCGAVLLDLDLNHTTVKTPPGQLPDVPMYEPGALIRLFDNLPAMRPGQLTGLILPDRRIPLDSCGMLTSEVTR